MAASPRFLGSGDRVKRLRLAIVGFGRLGRACAEAALHAHDLELVGEASLRPGASLLAVALSASRIERKRR